jgi:hypothetical protein
MAEYTKIAAYFQECLGGLASEILLVHLCAEGFHGGTAEVDLPLIDHLDCMMLDPLCEILRIRWVY